MPHQKLPANLDSLKEFFQKQGYQAEMQAPIENVVPIEQLVIAIGQDDEEQNILLRLFWTGDVDQNQPLEQSQVQFLQFLVLFPFFIKEESIKDLSTLIFDTNAALDMSSFGLYTEAKLMYYRYTHVCSDRIIDVESLKAILASIEFLIEMLLDSLKAVALGKKTLKQLQDESMAEMNDQILE